MAGHDAQQFVAVGYGDPLPEAFVDATQEVLGTLGRLDLTLADARTVRALAGAGADEAGMGIGGALRWATANVDRAMPAGGAGRYDVYVTTGATTIAPGDPPTDSTDYSWALAIVSGGGAAPSGGGIAYAKKVGYLDWNGTAITRLVQTFARRDDAAVMPTAPHGAVSAVDARSPAGATAPPIRAQVGATEVFRVGADGAVAATGALSAASAAFTGAVSAGSAHLTGAGKAALAFDGTAGITFGSDVTLYRDSADVLRTDDNLWANFNVSAGVGTSGQATLGGVGPASQAAVLLNDATLYRAGAGLLRTPGSLTVDGTLTANTLTFTGGTIDSLTVTNVLTHTGTLLGFYNAAAVAKSAARTLTSWTAGANTRRSIDRASFTEQELFDFVMTLANDLRLMGLIG